MHSGVSILVANTCVCVCVWWSILIALVSVPYKSQVDEPPGQVSFLALDLLYRAADVEYVSRG